MDKFRRARPTLLTLSMLPRDGWRNPYDYKRVADQDFHSIVNLSDLDHPLIAKAQASFSEKPEEDQHEGRIQSVSDFTLLEIKIEQWRGGVYDDGENCWLVAGGLAKGGHQDRDDFYEELRRKQAQGTVGELLPTDEDHKLLEYQRSNWLLKEYELELQRQVSAKVKRLFEELKTHNLDTHQTQIQVQSVVRPRMMVAEASIELALEDAEANQLAITLDIDFQNSASDAEKQHIINLLLSFIYPPEQAWAISWLNGTNGIFSVVLSAEDLETTVKSLGELIQNDDLQLSEFGKVSHIIGSRWKALTEASVEGKAVTGLCGTSFVPMQDHHKYPVCVDCAYSYLIENA